MEVQNEEEVEDPLNEHWSPANETCLQSVIPDYPLLTLQVEKFTICPWRKQTPSVFND